MPWSVVVLFVATLSLLGCAGSSGGGNPCLLCWNAPPQDCAALPSANWNVGPLATSDPSGIHVSVGESRNFFLLPAIDSDCASSVASVSWSISDASIATSTPEVPSYRGSWITGVHPGSTAVRARIQFTGGETREATPQTVIVEAGSPAAGALVAEGVLEMPPDRANARNQSLRLPQDSSRVDIFVDWDSPLDEVGFSLYAGTCAGNEFCAALQYVSVPTVTNLKPIRTYASDLRRGDYTLRLWNVGPGSESVRYEVRSTPR
jgi:hypothetical protein